MTAELVPLRTGFDVGWLGFRRDQVRHYVHATEHDIAVLIADRDAAESRARSLAAHLEQARQENRALRDRIERLRAVPLSPAAVGERLRHVVEQALADAADITEQAGALYDSAWDTARRTHGEHRELLTMARERMARLDRESELRRRALDEAAAVRRAQVDEDFELALALRRKETCHDVRMMELTARQRAERIVRDATRQAELLREHRDRVAGVLRVVHALLGEAAEHVRTKDCAR